MEGIRWKKTRGDLQTDNKRNGHSTKNLKSQYGEFQIDVPRDRNGEFDPKLIPKCQRGISGIEEKVISMYARGMNTQDIHDQLNDLYGIDLSAEMVSKITDKILPQMKEWQSRPLNAVYPFVFMERKSGWQKIKIPAIPALFHQHIIARKSLSYSRAHRKRQ